MLFRVGSFLKLSYSPMIFLILVGMVTSQIPQDIQKSPPSYEESESTDRGSNLVEYYPEPSIFQDNQPF